MPLKAIQVARAVSAAALSLPEDGGNCRVPGAPGTATS